MKTGNLTSFQKIHGNTKPKKETTQQYFFILLMWNLIILYFDTWKFDSDLFFFRVESEGPKSLAVAVSLLAPEVQVLDMPVDPNEPTYCLCHQVSSLEKNQKLLKFDKLLASLCCLLMNMQGTLLSLSYIVLLLRYVTKIAFLWFLLPRFHMVKW